MFPWFECCKLPAEHQIQLLSQLTVQSIDFPLCATRVQYILHLWDATVFAPVFPSYTAIYTYTFSVVTWTDGIIGYVFIVVGCRLWLRFNFGCFRLSLSCIRRFPLTVFCPARPAWWRRSVRPAQAGCWNLCASVGERQPPREEAIFFTDFSIQFYKPSNHNVPDTAPAPFWNNVYYFRKMLAFE